MEDNFWPAEPDLAVAEGCRNELTPTDSDSSSVTVDNSKHFSRESANDRPHMAWTNEKHNSYLGALEASFVKQLHHSLGLFFNHSEQSTFEPGPFKELPVNTNNFSDEKINFEKCHASASQECKIFHSEGLPLRGKRIFSHGYPSVGQKCACHKAPQDAIEVSDQNFVDEDREENSDNLSLAKRLKMVAADTSTEDQMVPSVFVGTSTAHNELSVEGRLHRETENL
ncbi:hypothetical protein NMG60_11015290 [Bertholletia excelsa]